MFTDENPMDIYASQDFEHLGIKDFYTLEEIIVSANVKKEYKLRAFVIWSIKRRMDLSVSSFCDSCYFTLYSPFVVSKARRGENKLKFFTRSNWKKCKNVPEKSY